MEILENLAKEINKDWEDYKAIVSEGVLHIGYDGFPVIVVDEYFNIEVLEENHEDALDQLNYMLSR